MEYGAEFTVRCVVETCLSDTVVQMFTGDQLVDSITEQERTKLSAYAQLRATEGVVGTYACQAMSEYANYVTTSTFEITGKFCSILLVQLQYRKSGNFHSRFFCIGNFHGF